MWEAGKAAEKHLELHENPGISTAGDGIAADQAPRRLAHTSATSPTLIVAAVEYTALLYFNTHTWQPQCVQREAKDEAGLKSGDGLSGGEPNG